MSDFVRTGNKQFTASALIENHEQFLLLYHKKIGLWLYPGGHVEVNEEPQDAMLREVAEEIGVRIVLDDTVSDLSSSLPPGKVAELPMPLAILCERIEARQNEDTHWHVDMIYHCHMPDDDRRGLIEGDALRWVTAEEAQQLPCPPELPALMKRALAKRNGFRQLAS